MLAIAARRADGWQEALDAGSSPGPPKKKTTPAGGVAIERERSKARKARDEARRAKEDAGAEVAAARKRAAQLGSEVTAQALRIRELQRDLGAAHKENESLRAEIEREVRKARRRAEKAEGELDRVAKELRATDRKLAARAAPPKPPATKPAAARRPRPMKEPQRRVRLPVPKGRFEDAPETLEAWLATPEVHLLVDGYNVSKATGGFGDLSLETQRLRLVQELGRLARRHGIRASIVFDGSDIGPGTSRRSRGPVAVEYSHPDEIADDHLVAKLEGLPKHPVIVVTNDRDLQRRTARLGATIATSDQLLKLIR
jgi:predicted RNA-binding protein with PIN domain